MSRIAARVPFEGGYGMKTMPVKCRDVNEVRAFCDCIADEDSVDEAARAFCLRSSGNPYVTGDELAELKQALMDIED